MSEEIQDQEVDLIEDINEEQLETVAEDVEVDEELSEAAKKKAEEKEAEVEVDDEEGEVEDDDDDEDDDEDDEDGDEDEEPAESKKKTESKKMAKESAEVPTTKAGMMKAMFDTLSEMSKDDLTTAYTKVMSEEVVVEEEAVAESVEPEVKFNFEEDLDALVSEEADLTEGFKDKAAVIFEAAVKSKLSAEIEKLEESYEEKLAQQVETVHSDLVEKVDGYLNYVVENWMEQNEVAINNGLRASIAENFINQLQTVFVENYIEVPETKVDLVDELAAANEELEENLNKAIGENIELTEKVANFAREDIIREATVGMAETEVEKLRSLTENLDFDDIETFTDKVQTVKESYFKVKNADIQEELQEGTKEQIHSPSMAAYLKALKSK